MNKSFLVFLYSLLFPFPSGLVTNPCMIKPPEQTDGIRIESQLPAGLHHAGDLSVKSQFPETDPAYSKIPHESARPSTAMTPVMLSHLEFRFFLGFFKKRLSGQTISS